MGRALGFSPSLIRGDDMSKPKLAIFDMDLIISSSSGDSYRKEAQWSEERI